MARTPLLNMLRRLARDRAVAEVTERESIGRRAVLGLGAGATLFAMVPAVGFAATARVAVVGAGLAGLTAAHQLRKAGYDADVFEDSTRLGGRCYTGAGYSATTRLPSTVASSSIRITRRSAPLRRSWAWYWTTCWPRPPPRTRSLYLFDGKPYTLADATRDFQPLYPILQQQSAAVGEYDYRAANTAARRFDAMTITDWIAAYVSGGRSGQFGQLIETALAEENGADADQQSALNVISALAANRRNNFNLYNTDSDQRFHVRGGNDQITTLLGKSLGARVRTAMPLAAVLRLPDGRIRLSLKRDGGLVDMVYDRVILALPFSVMRSAVDFKEAGFRPLKRQAIATLPMGASAKFQLQFTRRAWTDAGCNGEIRVPSRSFQTTWEVTRAQAGQAGILNFFSGGTRALNAGKTDTVTLAATVMKDAEPIVPGLSALWTGLMTKDAWKENPWSLGSYSYYQPGYQTSVAGIESEAEGNCFFAGEHTASQTGFLNAAVESGMRAAGQVVASLG